MTNNNISNKLANACLYFSTTQSFPLKQSIFEQHLNTLQKANKDKLLQYKIQELLIQRYYEIVQHLNQNKLEQYLMIRYVKFITQLIEIKKQCDLQQLVVLMWAAVTQLKKSTPEIQNKQIIKQILDLIQIVVNKMMEDKNCKLQSIYPQLSSSIMHFVTNSHLVNHVIYGKSLYIMGQLIFKIFQKRKQLDFGIRTTLEINKNQGKSKTFEEQCFIRLQSYLKIMANKAPSMQLVYYDSISTFIQTIWLIAQKNINILCLLAILGQYVNTQLSFKNLSVSYVNLIKSALTKQFIAILDTPKSNVLHHTSVLQKLQKLAPTLSPTQQQCQYLLLKFTNFFYIVQNSKSLVLPQSQTKQSLHLIKLQKYHSFSTYPIGIGSLLQSFEFQCERILLVKMPYAETNLGNIGLLKRILQKLPENVANTLLCNLLEALSIQQNQYMVDMSLTKFCQFVTKILIVYWLVRKLNFKLRNDIALNLFQTLSSCQAIRILQPSFSQQQILIGFTLLISYHCYNSLTQQKQSKPQLSQIKKLKLKLTLLQMAINNVYQPSYIIRSAAYFIILSQSAPGTVQQYLTNLQSTLINRNINNFNFIISLIQFCQLSSVQCEDLAEKFMQHPGSQQLLRILLPRLQTATIRKCLLSASNIRGKWIHMLKGNSKLLYNMSIQQKQQLEFKVDNFYMNDGSNVKISNALGVVLLQLGNKWQFALKKDSPYKQPALDLLIELICLDSNMVFFKNRFITILASLNDILSQPQFNKTNDSNTLMQRTRSKIYSIISKIPEINFKCYKKYLNQPSSKNLFIKLSPNILNDLLLNVEKRHKKYQLNYLMNSSNAEASQMYDNSDAIIIKLKGAIEDFDQQKSKEERND